MEEEVVERPAKKQAGLGRFGFVGASKEEIGSTTDPSAPCRFDNHQISVFHYRFQLDFAGNPLVMLERLRRMKFGARRGTQTSFSSRLTLMLPALSSIIKLGHPIRI